MQQSAVRLARAYVPMIRFVGGRHPAVARGEAGPHPCTSGGLAPGSPECVSVAEYLSKLTPFRVVRYTKPQAGVNGSRYEFRQRELQEGELSSVLDLPARYRTRPLEDAEMECINQGGIY
ncbi:AFR260Cp [Eremothecium gossypii ATCC 10895]|uniref:AFR260Cp n=1 Tax=Eremothecium gossypii (strain ATCC 10895 / CBS 109.51 / FGSC 9923 / NRRL Y-1056) TaxID=284811 RepID=Q753R6_EREGS|nr:mitochondrial 37S ribosomal protein YMR31 [Eremothecium gossypii ATCC 10895]AAS53631.1 AFR260Cp [Eremothecium gossypii ATCC 10895]AEY97944.1 FAFR260Cp [Eremothecium gossypii FDAG1]